MGSPHRAMRRERVHGPNGPDVPFCPACGVRLPDQFLDEPFIEGGPPNSPELLPRPLDPRDCNHSEPLRRRAIEAMIALARDRS